MQLLLAKAAMNSKNTALATKQAGEFFFFFVLIIFKEIMMPLKKKVLNLFEPLLKKVMER